MKPWANGSAGSITNWFMPIMKDLVPMLGTTQGWPFGSVERVAVPVK